MAEFERNIPPKIYHTNDTDGIVELWKNLVEETTDGERDQAAAFQEIVDPDTAPMPFVELLLASLGNPFKSVYLTDLQKRKLARLLIPMYRQKGTARGIINAVRFLLGIELEIEDPHGVDGWEIGYAGSTLTGQYPPDVWQVGIHEIGRNTYVGPGGVVTFVGATKGEVGFSTYVGGRRFYRNMLDYSEAFDNAVWTKTNASVSADAAAGPSPWGRPADRLNMTAAGAIVSQAATPRRIAGEWFTGSVWLKAAAPGSISGIIRAANSPTIDRTVTTLNLTTGWQRLEFQHQCFGGATGNIEFVLTSAAGFAPNLYAFGAQLVRSEFQQPYWRRTDDGVDEWELGRWGYHFFIQSPVALSADQERVIALVADFMKPAHTHYSIIAPGDPGFIDHWEVGLSQVGVNTFVHS